MGVVRVGLGEVRRVRVVRGVRGCYTVRVVTCTCSVVRGLGVVRGG